MTALPDAYAWLRNEPGPKMLLEALKLYGTLEEPGSPDNPVIIGWADEVGAAVKTAYAQWAANWYDNDSIPWCSLAMAVCAVRANPEGRADRNPPEKYLSALEWANYGRAVPKDQASLGDILVFQRAGGGHVGIYVGHDRNFVHVLGGNQDDAFNIQRISKNRLVAVRRTPYIVTPDNIRPVEMAADGPVSTNEA